MSLTPEAAAALVAQLETDAALMHQIVHGDASTIVATEGGDVDSLARKLAWIAAQISDEVTGLASKQPLDADLTAIAALATTAYGRAILTLADGAGLRGLTNAREVLTANRTYYVSPTGNNSNDGLTPGSAFATVYKAYDVALKKLDTAGYTVTAQLADGTYNETVQISAPLVGSGVFVISGSGANPGNVILSAAAIGTVETYATGQQILLQHLELRNSSGSGVYCGAPGTFLRIGAGMRFGTCSVAHIVCAFGSFLRCENSYSIVGNAKQHLSISNSILQYYPLTVTLVGSIAFSVRFLGASLLANVQIAQVTFVGSATGARYYVGQNAIIFTNGGGATYFPGDAAGAVVSGGQYI
jgi:hypothetical protein